MKKFLIIFFFLFCIEAKASKTNLNKFTLWIHNNETDYLANHILYKYHNLEIETDYIFEEDLYTRQFLLCVEVSSIEYFRLFRNNVSDFILDEEEKKDFIEELNKDLLSLSKECVYINIQEEVKREEFNSIIFNKW